MYNEPFPAADTDSSHIAQVNNVLKISQITLIALQGCTEDYNWQQLKNTLRDQSRHANIDRWHFTFRFQK